LQKTLGNNEGKVNEKGQKRLGRTVCRRQPPNGKETSKGTKENSSKRIEPAGGGIGGAVMLTGKRTSGLGSGERKNCARTATKDTEREGRNNNLKGRVILNRGGDQRRRPAQNN